jgi:hypothetical protein
MDEMSKKNKCQILRLSQQYDQAAKENKSLKHDIHTIPEGIDPEKYNREMEAENDALQMSTDFSEN